MSTVESILQNGSHEKSFLQYPKCTVCGAYLVASDDCGYIKSDFLFEPCECIKSSALLGTYKDSNTKIVDKKGNEVKVAIKAKHILNLLSQEISTPGSFATNNSNVTKDSSMVNLINPNIHDAERAFLHFEANFSNKPLGSLIKQHEDRKEKELKVENELFTEEDEYNVNFKDSSVLNTTDKKPTFKKFGISPAPAPVPAPLKPSPIAKPTTLTPPIPPIGPTPPPPGPTAGPTTGPPSGPSAGGPGGSTSTPSGPTSSVTATGHEEIIKEVKNTLTEIKTQNDASLNTVKEVKDLITEILAIDNKADVDAITAKLKEVADSQGELSKLISTAGNKIKNYSKKNAKVKTKKTNADAAKVSANDAKKLSDEAKQYADEAKQLAEAKKEEVERVKKEAEEKAKADAEKAKKEAEDLAKNIVELKKESSDLLYYCNKAITTIENNLNTASGSYTKASTFKNKINETDYSSKLDELSDKITKAKSELEDYKNKFNSASTILNSGTDDKDSLLKVKTTVADLKDELRNALKTVDEIMKESNELEREGSQKIKEKADAAEKLKTLKGEASTLLGDSKAIIGELEIILVDVDAKFNTIKTLSDDINEQDFTTQVVVVKGKIDSAKTEFEENKTKFTNVSKKIKDASDETEANDAKDLAEELKGELETTKKIVSDPIATELDKIATEGKGKASEKANQEAEKKKKEAEKKKEEADKKLAEKKKEVTDKLKERVEKLAELRKQNVLPVIEEINKNKDAMDKKVAEVKELYKKASEKVDEYRKLAKDADDSVNAVNKDKVNVLDENNNAIPDVVILGESLLLKAIEDSLTVSKQELDVDTVETTINDLLKELEDESQDSKDTLAGLYKQIVEAVSVESIEKMDNIKPYLEKYEKNYANEETAKNVKSKFDDLVKKLDKSLAGIKKASDNTFKSNFEQVKKKIDDKGKEVSDIEEKIKKFNQAAQDKKQQLAKLISSFRVPESKFYGSNSKTTLMDLDVNMRGKLMAMAWFNDDDGYFKENVVNDNYDLPTRKVTKEGSPYNYIYKYDPIGELMLTNDRLDLILEAVKNQVTIASSDSIVFKEFNDTFKAGSKLSNYARLIFFNSVRLGISSKDVVAIAKVYNKSIGDIVEGDDNSNAVTIAKAIITIVRVALTHRPVFEESLVKYREEYKKLSQEGKYIVSGISMSAEAKIPESLTADSLKDAPILDGEQFAANIEENHPEEEQKEMKKLLVDNQTKTSDDEFYAMLVYAKRFSEYKATEVGLDEYNLLNDKVVLRKVLEEVIEKHRSVSQAEQERIESIESTKALIVEIAFNWFWRWNGGYDRLNFDAWDTQVISNVVNNLTQQQQNNNPPPPQQNNPPPSPKAANNTPPPQQNNTQQQQTSNTSDDPNDINNKVKDMNWNQLKLLAMASIDDDIYDAPFKTEEELKQVTKEERDEVIKNIVLLTFKRTLDYQKDIRSMSQKEQEEVLETVRTEQGLVHATNPNLVWKPVRKKTDYNDWPYVYIVNLGNAFFKENKETGIFENDVKAIETLKEVLSQFKISYAATDTPYNLMGHFADYFIANFSFVEV